MLPVSLKILRLALAVTFFYIGILIFQSPLAWGNYLQPWAANLLSSHLYSAMILTSLLDITIGVLLFFNLFIWIISLLATLHLISVLIVSGITEITIRDLGLIGASFVLFIQTLPPSYQRCLRFTRLRCWL